MRVFFFFNDTATTEIYTLSLHDALPIFAPLAAVLAGRVRAALEVLDGLGRERDAERPADPDLGTRGVHGTSNVWLGSPYSTTSTPRGTHDHRTPDVLPRARRPHRGRRRAGPHGRHPADGLGAGPGPRHQPAAGRGHAGRRAGARRRPPER